MMEYVPVLILMLAGAVIGSVVILISSLLGPRLPNKMKNQPFECGVPPVGTARQRVSVRFYLVAILFLLFDVEVVFFYPWAVVYKKYHGVFILQ
jgi:NADH-quinone oxidoreductase subunit A